MIRAILLPMSNRILVLYGSYRSDRMGIRLANFVIDRLQRARRRRTKPLRRPDLTEEAVELSGEIA